MIYFCCFIKHDFIGTDKSATEKKCLHRRIFLREGGGGLNRDKEVKS